MRSVSSGKINATRSGAVTYSRYYVAPNAPHGGKKNRLEEQRRNISPPQRAHSVLLVQRHPLANHQMLPQYIVCWKCDAFSVYGTDVRAGGAKNRKEVRFRLGMCGGYQTGCVDST